MKSPTKKKNHIYKISYLQKWETPQTDGLQPSTAEGGARRLHGKRIPGIAALTSRACASPPAVLLSRCQRLGAPPSPGLRRSGTERSDRGANRRKQFSATPVKQPLLPAPQTLFIRAVTCRYCPVICRICHLPFAGQKEHLAKQRRTKLFG